MRATKRLLLVEDSTRQYLGLKDELESAGWEIIHVENAEQAISAYKAAWDTNRHVDVAAVDLGLPPVKDGPQIGLKLIAQLRQQDADLPILAYTSIPPTHANPSMYDAILATLLPLRVSFVYLRKMDNVNMAHLIEMVWQDFVLFSPGVSDYLELAVATRPDPLTPPLWETLAQLAQRKTYREIALVLADVGAEGVKARVNKIRETLIDAGELEDYEREQEDLINWYRQNHIRYRY